MKRFAAIAIFSLASVLAFGAELSASSRAEIESLLGTLGSSDCEFYRNGSWYSGIQAQAHLKRKYEYLANRGLISSAEEFIVESGTKSSLSGEPYQVRCPQQEAQPSSTWLAGELLRYRESHRFAPPR
jgi:hypothetical protein